MNRNYLLLVGVSLVAAALTLRLQGQETAPEPIVGHVLLLHTERTMEGEVSRIGNQYRLKRQQGEVWVPADKVLRACKDWSEVVEHMRSRANLGDPDERLRLSRWFQVNGRRKEALAEAEAALQLRPNHPATKQLVGVLQRQVNSETSPAASPGPLVAPKVDPTPAIDINSEAVAQFSTRVQPILMNTCAACHTGGRGGSFQLYRSNEGGVRGATQRNLAAALAQVDPHRPVLSPLLIKATSAHGLAEKPPLPGKKSIPFMALQEWVDQTLAANPHLREHGDTARQEREPEPPRFAAKTTPMLNKGKVEVVSQETPRFTSESTQPTPKVNEPAPTLVSKTPEPRPTPPTTTVQQETRAEIRPNDPFDPEIFNRQGRPK